MESKLRVCLINPPWKIAQRNVWSYMKPSFPHLGLLSLAAVLERDGIDVDIVDLAILSLDWTEIEEKIKILDYDYFGITATTPVANNAYRISRIIKRIHPRAQVVVGGAHPTVLPQEPFQKGEADFVIRGEGEEALLKLLKGVSLKEIPGLSYRDKEGIRHIYPDGLIVDLDSLPFAAYHKIPMSLYNPGVRAERSLAIHMITSRGCPGKCTYCYTATRPLRRRSAENIFEEIAVLYTKFGIKEIAFYDDIFTIYPTTVIQLCNLLIKNTIDISWSCFARADFVTLDLLKIMKSAGCHQIMYGIESGSEMILRNIKKEVSLIKCKEAITLTKKAGIKVFCAFMFGNPGETAETIKETVNFSIAIDPDLVMYNIAIPLPGTEMFNWAKNNNYLITENWDNYCFGGPVMKLPTIDNKSLNKKYRKAYWLFYARPSFIIRKLIHINFQQLAALFSALKTFLPFFIKSGIRRRAIKVAHRAHF